MTVALEFDGVSKRFTLQHERPESLQDRFVQVFRRQPTASTFWALRDVSFRVNDGETFGILGRNGAGKSTLLKLATGILQPSTGTVKQHRRTYAMLELGAGFHPELTGRDNVLLNGSIHGLGRDETRAIFDAIVAFAELEEFIDTPVKHYSSGMFMRLGFATAIHMKPELLVIDEILAVGDAAFRRKCTDALWALRRQGVTILFVSHNEEAVYQFCDRALLLTNGRIEAIGQVHDVVGVYSRQLDVQEASTVAVRPRLVIQAAAVLDQHGRETVALASDEPWAIEVVVATPPGTETLEGEVALQTDTGGQLIVAPLWLEAPADGAQLRHLRVQFDTMPLRNCRVRLRVRLTAAMAGSVPILDEYETPHSIAVGDVGYGPLLSLDHHWIDRTASPAGLEGSEWPSEVERPSALSRLGTLSDTAFSRYFAEASTGVDFATSLHIHNPHAESVTIALDFAYGDTCSGPAETSLEMAPAATSTVDLAPVVGQGKEFSILMRASQRLFCERHVEVANYAAVGGVAYNRPGVATLGGIVGSHRSLGVPATREIWHFAEGYTGLGFETYLALFNTTNEPITLRIRYSDAEGDSIERTLIMRGWSRQTVAVHDALDPAGLGSGRIFSTRIEATAPIVAERIVYSRHQSPGGVTRGVTAVAGVNQPELNWWFLASLLSDMVGAEYLAVSNPSEIAATIQVRYLTDGMADVERVLVLEPGRRATIIVHEPPSSANPAGLGRTGSIAIVLTASAPIVAERLAYWSQSATATMPRVEAAVASFGSLQSIGADEAALFGLTEPSTVWADVIVLINVGEGLATVRICEESQGDQRVLAACLVQPGAHQIIDVRRTRLTDGIDDQARTVRVEVSGEHGASIRCERGTLALGSNSALGWTVSSGIICPTILPESILVASARKLDVQCP